MYSHAPAMQAAPTAISHGALNHASARPASRGDARLATAAVSTDRGAATFDPTSRSGPARSSSVPRMPSE